MSIAMFRSKRPADSSAGQKPNKMFQKTDSSNAALSSDAETIKYQSLAHHHYSSASAGPNATQSYRTQPVPVPAAATFRQSQQSTSFNVVRSSTSPNVYPTPTARTSGTSHPEVYPSNALNQQQNYNYPLTGLTSSKSAVAPVSHPHRTSMQSLYTNTISTNSRSSVDQASIDNLQHSWDSNTLSTAPSSTVPKSTESLVRIQAASSDPKDWDGLLSPLDRSMGASRGFPLIESDGQGKTPTHGYTAGEQPTNALPLPNSEYESPARVRSLRRTKAQITSPDVSSTAPASIPSLRAATSTTGYASPAPAPRPPSPHKPQEHRRTKSDIPLSHEMDYRTRTEEHHSRSLFSRVMTTSSTPRHSHSSSTASSRPNMHQPRVASSSQSANPNMTKLKQTIIPRMGSSNDANASPMVDRRASQYPSLQSPRQQSVDSTLASWSNVKSPTMTSSGPAHSSFGTTVMSPQMSTIASPRTLVSSAHHSADIQPILPSQLQYAGSSVGKRGSVYVDQDRDSSASTVNAAPSSPASHVVRTLFSSLTSRPQRHSTPQPLRPSALSNPPIIAAQQEVASPRLAAAASGILSRPPLPPQSTRPDAPQQSMVQDANQYVPASPRHRPADSSKSAHSKPAVESRLAGLRSPTSTQSTTLRSYGLDGNAANPGTPIGAGQRNLGTPYLVPSRTLMSDSEVTTVTTVSVTRSTVVSQATATHPGERRTSSAQRRASINSTTSRTVPHQQQLQQPYQHQAQASQQPQQSSGIFNMFRPKSPKSFPTMDRPSSPAPPLPAPPPSKTPPPRSATASPRRFAFSLPLNFRHKPKKSISGASVEAVIGGTAFGIANDGAMSSRGSLRRSATPELQYDYAGSTVNGGRYNSATRTQRRHGDEDTQDEGEDYQDYADRDGDDNVEVDDDFLLEKMRAVQDWNHSTEANWEQSGKRRARPGVSFDIPASESERDDSGLTAVSAVRGAGRILRYQRQFSQTRQFSDTESFVY